MTARRIVGQLAVLMLVACVAFVAGLLWPESDTMECRPIDPTGYNVAGPY